MATIPEQLFAIGRAVVYGKELTEIDLYGLAGVIEIDRIRPEYLPGPKTISGTPTERKAEIFRLAEALWSTQPATWLQLENHWLQSARIRSGSTETEGKDNLSDVISAELLIRLFATIQFVDSLDKQESLASDVLRQEAINTLNLTLKEVVARGRTRILRVDGKTIYSQLKAAGIMIGSGGGKYLPDPETSLPILFQYLQKDAISPQAYR